MNFVAEVLLILTVLRTFKTNTMSVHKETTLHVRKYNLI